MLIGAPTYFFLSSSQPDFGITHIGGPQIFAVIYMGVIASALLLAYWGHLLLRYSPAKISVFFFMTPIVGVVGSALYLGEQLGWHLLVGAALTATGVVARDGGEEVGASRTCGHADHSFHQPSRRAVDDDFLGHGAIGCFCDDGRLSSARRRDVPGGCRPHHLGRPREPRCPVSGRRRRGTSRP